MPFSRVLIAASLSALFAAAAPLEAAAQSIGIPLRDGAPARRAAEPTPPPPAAARPAAAPRRTAPRRAAPRGCKPFDVSRGQFETVYVVNETPITGFDLEQRGRLMQFAAGRCVDDNESRALEELIDDTLKLDEARRIGVALEPNVMGDAFQSVLASNRISEEQFLGEMKKAGVQRATFEGQLRADILWGRVLRERYGDRLQPTTEEIDTAFENQETRRAPGGYDVRQLFVAIAQNIPTSDPRFAAAARRIEAGYAQTTSCSKLMELAPNFDRGPNAFSRSGRVGVMTERQMPPPLREKILNMSAGQKARPIRSDIGLHMFMHCGRAEGAVQRRSREQIEARLRTDRLERFSESYLEELRRTAFLEAR